MQADLVLVWRFGETMGELKPDTLFYQNPTDFLKRTVNRILRAVDDVPRCSRTELRHLGSSLFPRLAAYAYVCSKFSPSDLGLPALKKQLDQWASLGPVTLLASYGSVQDTLEESLRQCNFDFHVSRALLYKIRRLDNLCLVARALATLSDGQQRRSVLRTTGFEAQALLDLLQAILDHHESYPSRSLTLRVLYRLSKNSALYPASLVLDGVKKEGSSAVDGGSFGDIWKGSIGETAVAIKVMRKLNSSVAEKSIKAFSREAVLWRQFYHPNVLPFYGVHLWHEEYSQSDRVCLVSPWMENGNIMKYLETALNPNRTSLLLDVARGIEYLHTLDPPAIHGDLKGTNILITRSLRACVADFGLSTLMEDQGFQFTPTYSKAGAFLFRAPELLNHEQVEGFGERQEPSRKTRAIDVYAFGCVCYQIFTGKPRFHNLSPFAAMTAIIHSQQVLKPAIIQDTLWDLMQKCWKVAQDSRPTISELIHILEPQVPSMVETEAGSAWNQSIMLLLRSPVLDTPSFPEEVDDDRKYPKLLEGDQTLAITEEDLIIAIMGPTGTGKSSFVNQVMRRAVASVHNSLASCTQEVRAFSCLHPDGSGRKVILVDTPGFEDTYRSDYEILEAIAKWLADTYKRDILLTGILQFHSIQETRIRGTPLRNLEMFQRLCGDAAMSNVILTTTFWDQVPPERGESREKELELEYWKDMISRGCGISRFQPMSHHSAWKLINRFDTSKRRRLLIQKELVDEGKKLYETSAFKFLAEWWSLFIERLRGILGGRETQELRRALKQKKQLDDRESQRSSSIRSSSTSYRSQFSRKGTNNSSNK